jgi:hypothetical protein
VGAGLVLASFLIAVVCFAGTAQGGQGEGYFYKKGPVRIPDGHGNARMKIHSVLPGDVDPTIDYVSVSLRVAHPHTHDLRVELKRPNFPYMGNPQSDIPRVVVLDNHDTHGEDLGRGRCPKPADATHVPHRFTTLNDSGGPPVPTTGTPSPSLSSGSAPYTGVFAPSEPLSDPNEYDFNGYHAAPSTDPASPETWTLTVKDTHQGHSGKLLCAFLYLHRV